MSDIGKTALKTKIDNKVYENSSQAITGTIMNEVLQDVVDTLADGGNLDAGSVDTANIKDGAVTDGKLDTGVLNKVDWATASQSYYRNSQAGNVAAKTLTTYTDGYVMRGGGSLKVTFENANTADNATLNIDNKGAKPLYYNGARVSSTNSWAAGETVEIYYNSYNSGVYYARSIDYDSEPTSDSGKNVTSGVVKEAMDNVQSDADCAIAANSLYYNTQLGDVAAKVVNATGYTLFAGGSIKVHFEHKNTASAPTLNVNGTGAHQITYNGSLVSDTNSWEDGETVELFYDAYNVGLWHGHKASPLNVSVSQNTLTIGGVDKGELAGQLIENPEWVQVVTDSEDKILFGVKTDGKFYFGADCPPQVQDYVQQQINEYGVSVATLLDTKVDKVTGKSLIDADFASSQSTTDDSEYLDVMTDSEYKILEGVTKDGMKKFNIPVSIEGTEIKRINNPEFITVDTDSDGRIIEGITKDGQKEILLPLRNKFLEDKIKNVEEKTKASYNSKSYYDKGNVLSPLIRNNEGKPLIYNSSAFFNRPICYPDGTIIYGASSGNQIKKKAIDGTETTLLTVEGAISFRMIWMDSNYNVYVSPEFSGGTYYQNSGLYKLAYGENTFEQVLSLEDIYSTTAEERASETYTIWTMTEDAQGNLYVGIYGQPNCPYLYKSTDGGDNWNFLKDLSLIVPNGKHIHFIIYNKYDDALYCTVGEVNMLIKSTDGGNNWIDCNVEFERMKSTSACVVNDGIVFGSDYAYWGMMYKLYADGSYKTTAKIWANAIFAIRQSDLTGYLYAIGVIDSAVNSRDWYPPVEALSDSSVLQSWIESNPAHLVEWQEYYESMKNVYPSDAIRPQHTAILRSRDNGESWEVLLRLSDQTSGALGTFKNGECSFTLAGTSHGAYVISEGKQNYANGGIDCSGQILIRLNSTNIVEQV